MLSGLAHDPLLRDLFAPLWVGGTACIPSSGTREDASWLAGWMREQQISVAHLTPAMGQVLQMGVGDGTLPELRYAFFSGDVLSYQLAGALYKLAPAVRCVNFYGTTETPQAMSYFVVSEEAAELTGVVTGVVTGVLSGVLSGVVPVGRGIEGVQLLVLNGRGQLCGVGELGEICVRTPYLAIGYLQDEGLTSLRFQPNPFTAEAGDRIYRTGDRGRYRADGSVVFVGRVDDQVKIRGFRVEPGEVECALMRHPSVRQVVVLSREPGLTSGEAMGADGRLAAYIVPEIGVPEIGVPPAAGELREWLRAELPAYMIPAEIMLLEAIPLLPNGKVDRQALQKHGGAAGATAVDFVAPSTATEVLIVDIWRELLQVQRIGVHDNFYDLGGHSLLAARFAARLRDQVGVRINLAELTYQTLGQLAATHDRAVAIRQPSALGRLASRLGFGRVRSKVEIEGD